MCRLYWVVLKCNGRRTICEWWTIRSSIWNAHVPSAYMRAFERSCLPNAKWQPSLESYRWQMVYHHASPYLTGAQFYGHVVPRTGTMKRAIILFALGMCDQFQLHCRFCAIASLFMPVSLHACVTQRSNHNSVFHNLHIARACWTLYGHSFDSFTQNINANFMTQ